MSDEELKNILEKAGSSTNAEFGNYIKKKISESLGEEIGQHYFTKGKAISVLYALHKKGEKVDDIVDYFINTIKPIRDTYIPIEGDETNNNTYTVKLDELKDNIKKNKEVKPKGNPLHVQLKISAEENLGEKYAEDLKFGPLNIKGMTVEKFNEFNNYLIEHDDDIKKKINEGAHYGAQQLINDFLDRKTEEAKRMTEEEVKEMKEKKKPVETKMEDEEEEFEDAHEELPVTIKEPVAKERVVTEGTIIKDITEDEGKEMVTKDVEGSLVVLPEDKKEIKTVEDLNKFKHAELEVLNQLPLTIGVKLYMKGKKTYDEYVKIVDEYGDISKLEPKEQVKKIKEITERLLSDKSLRKQKFGTVSTKSKIEKLSKINFNKVRTARR